MSSLLFIISMLFLAAGLGYGRGAGSLIGGTNVINAIVKTFNGLGGLIFLMLLIAQFIAYFNYSNISNIAATSLADLLGRADIGALPLLIGFILLVFVIDLIMPGVIPKWAIIAPIFIPLFYNLGIAPQTVVAAYRVGDGPVNVITPLMVYLPFIILVCQRYRAKAGMGTVDLDDASRTPSSCWSPGSSSSSGGTSSASRGALALRSIWNRRAGGLAMDDATTALVVLGVVVALFVWNRLPVGVVAILAALALWATGLVTTDEAVAGLRRPGGHLHRHPVRGQRGHRLHRRDDLGGPAAARRRPARATSRVLVAVCLLSALLTSLITLNGAVAALLPLVVMLAYRVDQPPSQLLMPVAFAGSAGGLLLLMSSPVNLIVSEAADDAGEGPFAFFSFALVGLPLLVGTIAICLLLGPRLLPHRLPEHSPPDLGRHAETLEAHYQRTDGFYRLRVRGRSDLVGRRAPDLAALAGHRRARRRRRVGCRPAGRGRGRARTTSWSSPARRPRSRASRSTTAWPSR